MLSELREQVYEANMELQRSGLVLFTWGNVSGYDPNTGLVCIKPSGVDYNTLRPKDLVIVDLEGRKVEGDLRPSSDTPTHLVLYKFFPGIGGVAHTHSTYATAAAQAKVDLKAMGTTHGDYFYGDIPCTRTMTPGEIEVDYEYNTGLVIVERFEDIRPMDIPAVLVANHGPFTWGLDAMDSVFHSVVLEQIAKLNLLTLQFNPKAGAMSRELLDRHYLRKHGKNAYYGQVKK